MIISQQDAGALRGARVADGGRGDHCAPFYPSLTTSDQHFQGDKFMAPFITRRAETFSYPAPRNLICPSPECLGMTRQAIRLATCTAFPERIAVVAPERIAVVVPERIAVVVPDRIAVVVPDRIAVVVPERIAVL